ncbi:hypothetical protein BaRGS_00028895 [Batillaria attramentaria]|uniref:Uncharacterized protein n=1 Tax=Batillaria attramentaria TaxID=370345 RepID=A0ABD0JZA8_9CAEN
MHHARAKRGVRERQKQEEKKGTLEPRTVTSNTHARAHTLHSGLGRYRRTPASARVSVNEEEKLNTAGTFFRSGADCSLCEGESGAYVNGASDHRPTQEQWQCRRRRRADTKPLLTVLEPVVVAAELLLRYATTERDGAMRELE